MKKYIIILLFLFLPFILCFYSCKILNINQNGYSMLTRNERNSIRPFSFGTITMLRKITKDTIIIEEITFNDINELSQKYRYIWIHSFVPSCSQLNIEGLEKLFQLEKSYGNEMKLILLSETYDIKNIEYLSLLFGKPIIIYILNHQNYPSNTNKSDKILFKQLKSTNTKIELKGNRFSDYILKNGKLIKARNWKQTSDSFMDHFREIYIR